jgi:hypothetical protein
MNMKIRKIKKSIKKLECEVFKRQALSSLKLLQIWAKSKNYNATNIKICQNNFFKKGKFVNNGIWWN